LTTVVVNLCEGLLVLLDQRIIQLLSLGALGLSLLLDWMCKDPKTGEIFRADHLVEEVLEARLKGDKQARG
jgi:hypothetical protein